MYTAVVDGPRNKSYAMLPYYSCAL